MHHGFRIVDDLKDGLARWMTTKSYAGIEDFTGRAVANVRDWQYLNLEYKTIAAIDQDLCITCGLCHIACEDTAHQAIAALREGGRRRYEVIAGECVGCNLCLHVCPVEGCITMQRVDDGSGQRNWTQHPNNPMAVAE
jgi:dihydropyrimidine dehydrogenase (NAD+) subunit PreA